MWSFWHSTRVCQAIYLLSMLRNISCPRKAKLLMRACTTWPHPFLALQNPAHLLPQGASSCISHCFTGPLGPLLWARVLYCYVLIIPDTSMFKEKTTGTDLSIIDREIAASTHISLSIYSSAQFDLKYIYLQSLICIQMYRSILNQTVLFYCKPTWFPIIRPLIRLSLYLNISAC